MKITLCIQDLFLRYALPKAVVAFWMAARVEVELDVEARASVRIQLRNLLVDQRERADELAVAYASLTQALGDMDFDERRLVAEMERYGDYLDERILWIPSAAPVHLETLRDAVTAVAWLLDPHHWRAALATLLRTARGDAPLIAGAFLLVVLVALTRPRPGQLRGA